MPVKIPPKALFRQFSPSKFNQPIIVMQSPSSRAINVGYLQTKPKRSVFIPGRLNLGTIREADTYQATLQSLRLPPVQKILKKFPAQKISTITVLRETLACRLGNGLSEVGITPHYGDAFIGATHIKDNGPIRTAYLYENIEGLTPDGLWVVADSLCAGRNLAETFKSLLSKHKPQQVLILAPIASRLGIDTVGKILSDHHVPTTFLAWGALFGVDRQTLYDMPWGHAETEPFDPRDQVLMIQIFGRHLCMGGDFGNNYFCPAQALALYRQQLALHRIKVKLPSVASILKTYSVSDWVTRP